MAYRQSDTVYKNELPWPRIIDLLTKIIIFGKDVPHFKPISVVKVYERSSALNDKSSICCLQETRLLQRE
jgi:hypothetical protein